MKYYHIYFCRKVALLCSGLKGVSAGEITSTCDILTSSLGRQRICKASGIADVYRQR